MMFCPKCGSLMKAKQVKNKTVMSCSCGYSSKEVEKTLKEPIKQEDDQIEVLEDNEELYPIADEHCPECDNNKAFFWTQQTRAGDEPETKFFRCTKCKHTWRDYS